MDFKCITGAIFGSSLLLLNQQAIAAYPHHAAKPQANPVSATDVSTANVPTRNTVAMMHQPIQMDATSFASLMEKVTKINSAKSLEPLFPCWNNMLCVSGLLDFDARYFDHAGVGFGPTATTSGTGVRPTFGPKTQQLVGSINNGNIFVDLQFPELVKIHTNIAYVNGSVYTNSYAWSPAADWGSVYRNNAGIHADELFAVFSDPSKYPVYFKVGRMYLDFGQYTPNGYGLPTISPSLTQLMTQTRTGGAQLGFVTQNGFYGSATWSMAQWSLGNLGDASRNYSGKLGYFGQVGDAHFNVNASYLWDLRDADYFNDTLDYLNRYWAGNLDPQFVPLFTMRRQGAIALHGDAKFGAFGIGIEGATALGKLSYTNNDSRLYTAGIDGSYDFCTFGHESNIDLGYQIARNSSYIDGNGTFINPPFTGFPVGPFYHNLPKYRVVGTYIFKVVKHVNTALQWVHDKDFGGAHGTGHSSNFGIFRIDLEF